MGEKNHLAGEKSRYLKQHAENPVDWYPWCQEAFDKAEKEDKPIFLSIGYSSCHWCHVMAHESFEDEKVAELMNESFVSIKVDKEERPDVNNVYMEVAKAMTGAGGWPLNIVMTPDKKPFYAATYIPKRSRGDQTGMIKLTKSIDHLWNNNREKLLSPSEKIISSLRGRKGEFSDSIDVSVLDEGYETLKRTFDDEHHGFGSSPKFPSPHELLFLLKYWERTNEEKALDMVEKTLDAMRLGGIYDHIGYGFHRYSTDPQWKLPHFEKMLYDQAMMVMAYSMTYEVREEDRFKRTAEETIEYVLRDLKSKNGGFYSSQDADTGEVEGGYYIWSEEEIDEILNEPEMFKELYNVKSEGNYREESTGEKTGKNVLYLNEGIEYIAEEKGLDEEELKEKIEKMRRSLFEARKERETPGKDKKILTDWNGLMITALATASRIFDDKSIRKEAEKGLEFISSELEKGESLYHRYIDGEVGIDGMLDDYAFYIWALLEMYKTSGKGTYLEKAKELAKKMIEIFWDEENGGFYFSSTNELPLTKKEIYDGSYPSGNSVALLDLVQLSKMTDEELFEAKAQNLIKSFGGNVKGAPAQHTMLLYSIEAFVEEYGKTKLEEIE